MISWIYLLSAALFEIGWPVGLKMSVISSAKVAWLSLAVIAMILSSVFLYLAQKSIPIGTAYAVWTGLGAAGTFVIGLIFFHDAAALIRFVGIGFILIGVICLKSGG